MSTSPVQDARPAAAPERETSEKEKALSRRIRRSTLRRRLLQATDALAVADLLLGMNRSLDAMGEDSE